MAGLIELYRLADGQGIDIDWIPMEVAESLSVMLPDGSCCVALDPWKMETTAKETACLAHELGHCVQGAFYNRWAAMDVRKKHENRADKWAIKQLIPEDELQAAVEGGLTELWELAEHFDVTEGFMRKAVCWYCNHNLDSCG